MAPTSAARIGFVGLGAMGGPMARNLLRHFGTVTVYDVVPERIQELERDGAHAAPSCAAVAQESDFVVTMLPRTEHVEQAVFGPRGLAEGFREGVVLIDCSTIAPSATRRISERLAERGVAMIDAPVVTSQRPDRKPMPEGFESGSMNIGVASVTVGNLCFLVGGSADVVERCQPVLNAMGTEIRHVGPNGCGQVCKVINNAVVGASVVLLSELIVLGKKAGVDPRTLVDCLAGGSANSVVVRSHIQKFVLPHVFPERLFSVDYMHKDISLAVELGQDADMPMPLVGMAQQIFRAAQAAGWGNEYHAAVVKVFEKLGQVQWDD